MSGVWNEVTTIGDPAGGGRSEPDELVGASSVADYLSDDETAKYVVVGTDDGLGRETDDWQTTESPGSGRGVAVLVTDRRSVFLVGDCRDPDVDGDYVGRVEHAGVEDVTVTDSLLSTSLTLVTREGVRLSVTPADTDGLEDAARFVRRAKMQWRSAATFFEGVDEELLALEDEVAEGRTERADRRRQSVLTDLSELGQSSSLHAVDLPALEADRDRIQRRVEDALCRGYWHRARDLTGHGDARREAGERDAAAAAYRDACGAFQSMVDYGGPNDRAFTEDSLDRELDPFALEDALLDRLTAFDEELDAADAETATAAFPAVLAGYDHLLAAVRVGGDRLDADRGGLGATIRRVRQRTADAYLAAAKRREERGDAAYDDGDDDAARDRYERALDALAERRELAAAHDDVVTTEAIGDLADRLEEKIERSQWEWVGDQ